MQNIFANSGNSGRDGERGPRLSPVTASEAQGEQRRIQIAQLETELTSLQTARVESEQDAALCFHVLLADDSAADRFFARRALNRSPALRFVSEVCDGDEVVAYLSGAGKYADRAVYPFPSLLLLDIQMARMSGLDVLTWLREQNFPDLRVVMLSASLDQETIGQALALGADYYQSKPTGSATMADLVRLLELLMILLHHRQLKQIMNTRSLAETSFTPSVTLKVVDGRDENWNEAITAAADSRRNFILVLKSKRDLDRLWSALGATNVMPERLRRWGILAMAEALTSDDYGCLLNVYEDNAVYLIEQLTLNRNVPPRTQRYMLYCELRGIISDHASVEDAGIALLGYLNIFKRAQLLPLAGIYEYADGNWSRVKKLTSDSPS